MIAGAAPQAPLVGTDQICVPSAPADAALEEKRLAGRRAKYAMQDMSAALLPGSRVGMCGWKPVPEKQITIMLKQGRAGVAGVRMCGSVWVCPVCAVKVAAQRAEEIQQAVDAWEACGGTAGLLTFTMRHTRHEELADNLSALTAAMRAFWSGRWAKEFRAAWGLVGQIRNLETTWGASNGWHPHAHVLLFLGEHRDGDRVVMRRVSAEQAAQLQEQVRVRWAEVAARHGFTVTARRGATVELQDPDRVRGHYERESDGLGGYVTKLVPDEQLWGLGHELTWAHIKRTKGARYTPWMLLAACMNDHAVGDAESGAPALWQTYADAFAGRRQLFWSRGLRERLLGGAERSDEDLAHAHDEQAVELCTVPASAWYLVRRYGHVPALLEAAERGGEAGVRRFLATWRARALVPYWVSA